MKEAQAKYHLMQNNTTAKHLKNKTMSKKLETLLEAIEVGSWVPIRHAYHAYIEERNTMPQVGQYIEVRDDNEFNWSVRKFAAFAPNGDVITENKYGIVTRWNHYRIPVAKKKWRW